MIDIKSNLIDIKGHLIDVNEISAVTKIDFCREFPVDSNYIFYILFKNSNHKISFAEKDKSELEPIREDVVDLIMSATNPIQVNKF
jgi:hypothetical protein